MTKGFTLDKLAWALRGTRRHGARTLIRLPDGRLAEIDYVQPTYVRSPDGVLEGGNASQGAEYGVVLVPKIDTASR